MCTLKLEYIAAWCTYNMHGLLHAQAERKLTGIMNYTNPGAVSHNEILQMYKDYIDPEFTWKNFTVEEQAKVIVAPRSNNLLDTKRVRSRAGLHVDTKFMNS